MKTPARVLSPLLLFLASAVPGFCGLTYTCAADLSATACTGLTSIASLYNGVFSNIDADIYVQMGSTGLGESEYYWNEVTYSQYRSALASVATGTVEQDALASLPLSEPSLYGGGDVMVTSALAEALGITTFADDVPNTGITTSGGACFTPGSDGCYSGLITVSNSEPLYYRVGTQTASEYDFFSVVEHETDEVLGTASCVDVPSNGNPQDECGGSDPSAVDLFRYNSSGNRVLVDSTPGAFFAYNGVNGSGATNLLDGATYNTNVGGEDYADFSQSCEFIQDAVGCPGISLDITNDGPGGTPGPEITILNAVGFTLNTATPEPGTFVMLGLGLAALGVIGRRRASRSSATQESR